MMLPVVLLLALVGPSPPPASPVCEGHLLTVGLDGSVSSGSKEAVLAAFRAGLPLRVEWGLDFDHDGTLDLRHAADAGFLTEWRGEVFAQLDDIQRQAPQAGAPRVVMPAGRQRWTGILGTNGMLESHMDDGSESSAMRVWVRWCIDPRVPRDARLLRP
jgi:hypothetical protein